MLQRIQTVYLFLVFVFGLLYLLLPLATLGVGHEVYTLKSYEVVAPERITAHVDVTFFRAVFLTVLFAHMILTVITTYKYKKRLLQLKLGNLNLLLLLILIVLSFFYIDAIKNQIAAEVSYSVGLFFPFISIILILLANRGIRKDEALIRSINRVR